MNVELHIHKFMKYFLNFVLVQGVLNAVVIIVILLYFLLLLLVYFDTSCTAIQPTNKCRQCSVKSMAR